MTVNDIDSREFKYLEANQSEFAKLFGAQEVEQKIVSVYETILSKAVFKDKGSEYVAVKQQLLAGKSANAAKAVAFTDIDYYEQKKDWKNYAAAATHLAKQEVNNSNLLNTIAYTFYENIKDKAELTKALAWAKKSIDISESPANLDTYACLLFATGNKTDAIKEAKRAIELAKASGDEWLIKELEKSLQKFEKGK